MASAEAPSRDEVKGKVEASLKLLLSRDKYLLEKDVNERSISHRLAMYLQGEFANWDVDCEYNRDGCDAKRLNISRDKVGQPCLDDTDAPTVFPDIIVHHRSTNDNLLVIEIKKTTASNKDKEFDYCKLRAFKRHLGYTYALFLEFRTDCKQVGVQCEVWLEDD